VLRRIACWGCPIPACLPAGGHYTAHVQQPDGRWLDFNDAEVSGIKQENVLNQRAYMLLYQRL
jgi:ubiquitin C-terminal hydrolase